ncbi:hypothetical protein BDV95DRAFT_161246 [Massariosphaeria phaeospora]|uniref:Secreted protein n=1 Tax=Massariosphaeria phaeospora TaxID=100035 RepID=A0A7C8M4P7_9PLEO|nr:hypothetical protein BDV95DRAFT_161246 [Massariosphaeria phaeospora]
MDRKPSLKLWCLISTLASSPRCATSRSGTTTGRYCSSIYSRCTARLWILRARQDSGLQQHHRFLLCVFIVSIPSIPRGQRSQTYLRQEILHQSMSHPERVLWARSAAPTLSILDAMAVGVAAQLRNNAVIGTNATTPSVVKLTGSAVSMERSPRAVSGAISDICLSVLVV